MSYSSYIERELAIIGEDLSIMPQINELLKIIDGQGHSGASIRIFSGWFKAWAANPEPVTDKDSMLFEVSEVVKGLPLERRKQLLHYVAHAVRFMPLSPLTGADDEWINVSESSGHPLWQNKRMGEVFKDKDGTYRHDMVIWAYPTEDHWVWLTYTRGGGHSSKPVTFPYDPTLPENQPVTRYFQRDAWEHELPATIDPMEWLKWQHQIYLKGTDPRTGQVREKAMFVQMDSDAWFFDQLVTILCAMKYNPEWTRKRVIDKLRWVGDGEAIELEWAEPYNEGDGSLTFKRTIADVTLSSSLARMIALIPEHWQLMVSGQQFFDGYDHSDEPLFWDPVEKKEYCLDWRPVWVVGRNYQRWLVVKPLTTYHDHSKVNRLTNVVVPAYKEKGTDGEAFYYDAPYQVVGDEEAYLYHKRRELGLAHPPRKQQSISLVDSAHPVADVDKIVDEFMNSSSDKPTAGE